MKQELTRGWRFYRHGDPAGAGTVDLPHDAMITEPRSKCLNGANTGYFPGGRYVYERDLEIEEADIGKCISLIFEGVYRNATVSLNGEALAFHAYGYTEFEAVLS